MSRQESFESERDTKDGGTQHTIAGLGAHQQYMTSTSPVPPITSYPSALPQQYPLLDPNVMAVTNTAATIAAVAASALQHINQSKTPPSLTPPLPNSATTTSTAAVNPAIVAALSGRQHLLPTHQSHGAAALPHIAAALLGGPAATVGGAGAALHTTAPPGIHSGLHQALNPAEATLHPAAAAAAHATASSISNALLPNMQSWTLEQLEQHVKLLHRLNQPVPQSVALLLADARRKEKKRNAKRVANRKSASTSRARKKALVEEMTKINARLRRQALILALLPDLVIAITTDGTITFCSDQVQRVLMHSLDDLQGAKLVSLIAPVSRDALNNLIKEVSKSGGSSSARRRRASREGQESSQERVATKRRRASKQRDQGDTGASKATGADGDGKEAGNDSGQGSSRSAGGSGGDTSAAAVVSEQSFPLSVVEVESKRSAIGGSAAVAGGHANGTTAENAETNVNSDTSTSNGGKKQLSSLTNSANSASRSPTASSYEEDGGGRGGSRGSRESGRAEGSGKKKRKSHSSDDSSSLSSDAKNMRKANDNLDRNVRWHNQRMLKDTKKGKFFFGPKDDVTGASVTANNASARLSSLKHDPFIVSKSKDDKARRYERNEDQSSSDDSLLAGVEEKKKTENASDDSGYRESNDSREETSSSGSDTSNSNEHRKKNLASTCKICLIRNDLSTVWCEVTSSVRTRSSEEEIGSLDTETQQDANPSATGHSPKPEVKELLLCLRPIRDGEKADEAYRFVPQKKTSENDQTTTAETEGLAGLVSSSGNDEKASTEKNSSESTSNSGGGSNSNSAGTSSNKSTPKRPPKKRPLPKPDCSSEGDNYHDEVAGKKAKGSPVNTTDTEKSVVESLMLMNKSQ